MAATPVGRASTRRAPSFLTASEAGRRLGVSSTTATRWCHRGLIVAKRIGQRGRFRIDPAEVERLLAKLPAGLP